MGYLAHILAAAAALLAYEQGLQSGLQSWLGAAALLAGPHALMRLDRWLAVRGAFKAAGAVHALLGWYGPVGYALATCLFGWPALVQRWSGASSTLNGWPDAAFFLILAPFVAYAALAIDATARVNEVRGAEIARARTFQLRMLLAALAPFALFLGVTWLVGLDARMRVNVEQVALWGAVMTLALALAAVLTLPELLRRTWDTTPLPAGRARTAMEDFARHAGFRFRELLVWRTGHQLANAAVVGVGARQRVVVFSDLLLAQLPMREIVAVLAHEIGHAARHHVLTFIAWSAALFLGLDLALFAFGAPSELESTLAALGAIGLWWFGFGWLSRRSELEADLYAMETTGDVNAMVSALEIVGGPQARSKDTWRHFSTARRIDFLLHAAQDERVGARLTRRMRWWSRVGLALAVLLFTVHSWKLLQSYPDDRVRVELALGEYERADELSVADERVEPSTRRLSEVAVMLDPPQRSLEGLDLAARTALSRGDARRCAELLELMTLRGATEADELLEALQSDEAEQVLLRLRESRPDWAQALEAALRTGSR